MACAWLLQDSRNADRMPRSMPPEPSIEGDFRTFGAGPRACASHICAGVAALRPQAEAQADDPVVGALDVAFHHRMGGVGVAFGDRGDDRVVTRLRDRAGQARAW